MEDAIKDMSVVFHCLNLSQRAYQMGMHFPDLTSLRIKLFDLLACKLHDYHNARFLQKHIEEDMEKNIIHHEDKIAYLLSSSVYSIFHDANYEKAVHLGNEAFSLLFREEGKAEEKIRIIGNLIQYYIALGHLTPCSSLNRREKASFPK